MIFFHMKATFEKYVTLFSVGSKTPCHTFCKKEFFFLVFAVTNRWPPTLKSVTYFSNAALGCIHLLRQSLFDFLDPPPLVRMFVWEKKWF